jgi:tetratricopeptide (TPR) repeat protein
MVGDLGEPAKAYDLSVQALAMYRDVEDYRGVGDTLTDMGAELEVMGELPRAAETFEQAIATFREKGDTNGTAAPLNDLGEVLYAEGELARAKSSYEGALAVFRATRQKSKAVYPLYGLGQILLAQGDLNGAEAKFSESLELARTAGDRQQIAAASSGIGSVLYERGDLDSARKLHAQARLLRQQTGEKGAEAQSVLALAELKAEQGHLEQAEEEARQTIEEFRAEKQPHWELRAHALITRCRLAQNRVAEARKEVELSAKLAEATRVREARIVYAIAAARVQGSGSDIAKASQMLKAIIDEARRIGYLGCEFEARLTFGELTMKSGQAVLGRAQLESLSRDAVKKGFFRLGRKAARAAA